MKAAWDPTKLTVKFWNGPLPEEDDECVTGTGRRYRIFQIDLRDGQPRRLHCVVLPPDAPVLGRQFNWAWSARPRKRR